MRSMAAPLQHISFPPWGSWIARARKQAHLPTWFTAALMVMAINGVWMFRLATIEGAFHIPVGSPWGRSVRIAGDGESDYAP